MKVWITILAILIGVAVILGVKMQSAQTNAPSNRSAQVSNETTAPAGDAPTEATDEQVADTAGAADTATDAASESQDEAAAETKTEVTEAEKTADAADGTTATEKASAKNDKQTTESHVDPIPGLHAVEVDAQVTRDVTIGYTGQEADGSTTQKSPFKMGVKLSRYGAAVHRITLTDYLKTVGKADHYIVLDELRFEKKPNAEWFAYAAKAITVNGTRIPLETNLVWVTGDVKTDNKTSSVSYTATIADGNKEPVLEVIRTYSLTADSYDLSLDQRIINKTGKALEVRWEQNFQGDLVNDSGYLGDRRKYVSGYFAPWWDSTREGIYTQGAELVRSKIVGSKRADIWPVRGLNPEAELTWIGSLNRYFAVVTHAELNESVQKTADVPRLDTMFPKIDPSIAVRDGVAEPKDADKLMIITAGTDTLDLPAHDEKDLGLGIFAGPREPELFTNPPYSTLHLDQTIVYSLGGMCAFCTFQWLAHILLWLLKLFEGQVLVIGGLGIGVHDWGVSIILLVMLVRLLLHPLTKRAQINMMKMGKMMQAIQPEVEKLKKKYKDDQQKINAEMMKLYKEKGVNPANMLGCLPMFLQTPIWIALYAMLYYAIELRHQHAFWGLFQKGSHLVSGGAWDWGFLADLSRADNFFVVFEQPVKLNLLLIHPDFQAINILPILMAVVFYFQQKFTTPPPANEQQAQQQKMMKFMVFLFPVFLYSAPSGLTLYILASTTAGVIDSYIVRKHIKEQEESGELFAKKPPKPGGLRDRFGKIMEAKQAQIAAQQQQMQQKNYKQRKKK